MLMLLTSLMVSSSNIAMQPYHSSNMNFFVLFGTGSRSEL